MMLDYVSKVKQTYKENRNRNNHVYQGPVINRSTTK